MLTLLLPWCICFCFFSHWATTTCSPVGPVEGVTRSKRMSRLVYLADSVTSSRHNGRKSDSYVPLPLDKALYRPSLLRHKFSGPDERNFLLEFYLHDCIVDRIAFDDFKSAAAHNNTSLVKHFLAPGVTFFLPTDSAQPVHWLVQDLLLILDSYNASTSDYQFIHLNDETYFYQHPNLLRFYSRWRKVYRQNWWNTTVYRELHATNRLDWIPLTQLRSLFLQPHQIIPSHQRKFNITFRGNIGTNSKRKEHVKELQKALGFRITGDLFKSGDHSKDPTLKLPQALPSQRSRLSKWNTDIMNRAKRMPRSSTISGTGTGGIGMSETQSPPVSSSQSTYLREMAESIFCLNLKGRMPECHRLYEALDCGCIPVFIDNYASAHYAGMFEGWKSKLMEIQWRSDRDLPFVWADNVTHFVDIFNSYVNSGPAGKNRLDVLQRDNLEWWKVAQQHFKRHFENAFCSFNS